ncbi:MAG TPA: phosphotransferase [Dermatophilaceae bacterium]|nr:phosphotransferase [Dermatophilaceae bacterium]
MPCPEPVPLPQGGCLGRIRGRWVRVHRWVHGTVPAPGSHSLEAAALVARIHAGAPTAVSTLDDEPWDIGAWSGLAELPGMPGDLAASLRAAAPWLARLENETAEPGRPDVQVLSHGDLDPKNTLLVDGTLVAVDWDAAGPRSRIREAVSVALDWTSDTDGFRAAIDAYTGAAGAGISAEPWVFGGWVGATGGWLVYNAMHCAGTDQGRGEIVNATQRLTALHSNLSEYLAALT